VDRHNTVDGNVRGLGIYDVFDVIEWATPSMNAHVFDVIEWATPSMNAHIMSIHAGCGPFDYIENIVYT
jgi:hypothetical protein